MSNCSNPREVFHHNIMRLLLKNISFLVRNPKQVETDTDVLIDGKQVSAIGKGLRTNSNVDVIDATGCIVFPGFVNAHTHLYQNFLKGIAQGIPLIPWCNQVLFPTVGALREAFFAGDHRAAYLWSAAAAIEMIKSGTTCCINMDVTEEDSLVAWQDIGFRGVSAYTLTNKWVPAELRSDENEMRAKVLEFIQTWHKPDELTQVFLAPSTAFLCDDNLLEWVRDQAERLNIGIQIHVSEIASEVQDSINEYGVRPVEHLQRLGLLSSRLSAVHCVHVTSQEIEVLAKTGVRVVHCPKSNMKLADGIAPIVEMKRAGIPVSVATDGCGSNDLLDMWEDMRTSVLLARVANDNANALTAEDALYMGTKEPARICGIDAGEIDPGRLADLAVIDIKGAHLRPFHADQIINMMIFCARAGDVRDTIINGEVVMRDHQIIKINEDEIFEEIDRIEASLYRQRSSFQF